MFLSTAQFALSGGPLRSVWKKNPSNAHLPKKKKKEEATAEVVLEEEEGRGEETFRSSLFQQPILMGLKNGFFLLFLLQKSNFQK